MEYPNSNNTQSGAGTPISVKTPEFIGQTYIDTTNNDLYVATGLVNTAWIGPFNYTP